MPPILQEKVPSPPPLSIAARRGARGPPRGSPPPAGKGGPAQAACDPCSLQIYYWEAGGQNDTEKVKVLSLPETVVKLKNLTSHSRYLVSISAFNAAGDGPRSEPRPGRTHQAGRRGGRAFPSCLCWAPS